MKVLHVLYSGLGGHGNVFFSMLEADKKNEFKHEALFIGIEELREEYIKRCNKNAITWNFIKKKQRLDIAFYKKIIKTIRKANPQIIFLHGSTAILPAKIVTFFNRKKQRIIVRETHANHLKTTQDWIWLKMALLFAGKTVFLSDTYNEEIRKKHLLFYRKKRVTVIPNGIDLQKFNMPPKQRSDTMIIGMQGRIVKIKDHRTLLLAFAQLLKDPALANTKLLLRIAGDGDCRQQLQELVKELHIEGHVEFTGMLAEAELIGFLKELDIYIHASFGETMSTAIMQAMAAHKPIIASDVPGINNMIINGSTGILVFTKDVQGLYEKLNQLILSPAQAQELSDNAFNYAVSHFSMEQMFSKYRALFLA